jgi:ATP-dependent helicase HepA
MFCVIKGHESDGLGKLVQTIGNVCIVEYFDSPAQDGCVERQVSKSLVSPRRLGRNTRVYVISKMDNRWRVGRVLEDDGDGLYVRFTHKEDNYIRYADANVRWKRPIENPVIFLARFFTETPQYAEARSLFLQSYIEQRGAVFGMTALFSSSVELESHQIDVVRRVLNDPIQRYLLADEVGLGKTIEAGIVIRQAVLDSQHHRVVILAPVTLVRQWRQELIQRFGLKDFLDISVFVLPHEAGEKQVAALDGVTLLVVDEAHHIADPNGDHAIQHLYELLRQSAHRAERLLLLSATPILRNEAGFLRMLHLLDPTVYPLEDYERFRVKVEHRQELAEVVAMLSPENALFLDAALDDLAMRIPDDERLQRLVSELKDQLLITPEEDDPDLIARIRQLRAHISETYRLNRRILRNRRKHVSGLTPDRSGAQTWAVANSPLPRIESALEIWRIAACTAFGTDTAVPAVKALSAFYWEMAGACIEDPSLLPQLCARRRSMPAWPLGEDEGRFEHEDELLEQVAGLCYGEQWLDARCTQLIEQVRSLPGTTKAVVFCTTANAADVAFNRLKADRVNAVRHEVDLDEDVDLDSVESWVGFLTDPEVCVIVCDRFAEEGLNLQGGNKAVIHFDLPFQPNRIEQRMGRVDRYGAGSQVRSYVLFDSDAPFQRSWFNALQQGWGVFNQSISSLQYLVEDELGHLKKSLFAGGVEALQEMTMRIAGPQGLVASELKLIDQQDALDELSPMSESETENLFDVDSEWKRIRDAMLYWIADTLLFSAVSVPASKGSGTAIDQPVRFHYHPPESSGRATLIPLADFLKDFMSAIDYDAPGSGSSEPRSFVHAAHRTTAVRRGLRPLRYGNEFVEAIKTFSDIDDRGRSFALWRQIYEGLPPNEFKMCFRLDFLVETRLTKAEAVLAKRFGPDRAAASCAVLARRGDTLLAPFIICIWLDEDGDELMPEFIARFLAPKYAKEGGVGYIDKNLGSEHFGPLKRILPEAFGNWNERCLRMHDQARALVQARPELAMRKKVALARAHAQDDVRYAQLHTRIQSLSGTEAEVERAQLELEQRLNDALYEGIVEPELKVDIAGVVFLSEQPVSVIEAHMENRR